MSTTNANFTLEFQYAGLIYYCLMFISLLGLHVINIWQISPSTVVPQLYGDTVFGLCLAFMIRLLPVLVHTAFSESYCHIVLHVCTLVHQNSIDGEVTREAHALIYNFQRIAAAIQ